MTTPTARAASGASAASAVVLGAVGRDLVLLVDELPDAGTSAQVLWRREVLGGKGANQAVAFARLGMPVALVGVVGGDPAADGVLARARADGIDVSHVARRRDAATGLIVEILDRRNRWRYLEDMPDAVRLTVDDVNAATDTITRASSVVVQLQQPSASAVAAAELARGAGRRVVLDGVPEPEHHRALLELAHVIRVDPHEAELLTGLHLRDAHAALAAAEDVLRQGPDLVALAIEGEGNLFAWPDGHVYFPLDDVRPVDTTGAGDALIAALVTALDRGLAPAAAGRWAVAASSLAVEHPGGRPRMTLDSLRQRLESQHGQTLG
jgi:ribokinase